jgi:hypothetical protein
MLGAAETAHGVALDPGGNIYVTGETSSTNFPTRGPLQGTNAGWQDGFVSKFGPSGTLIYSTYLGGVNLDAANAIAVDAGGAAYIAGQTTSSTLAVQTMYQGVPTGVPDVFLAKLSAAGDALTAWNYFGGVGADTATAVAVDGSSNLYLAGWTQSPNFAVVNGFQSVNGGNYGAFVGKMSFGASAVAVTVAPSTATLKAAATQQFTATVTGASNTAVTWSINPAVGTLSTSGLYTAPAAVAAQQTVTVRATSVADPSKSAAATVTLAPVSVTLSPATATLSGAQTQQFTATVSNASSTSVTWSISPSVGSISAAGVYTAPALVTTGQTVTVTATSVADPSKSAAATVTLAPVTVTVSPASVTLSAGQTQQFTATVSNGTVTWSISPSVGSISASGVYTAPAPVTAAQTVTVTAKSVADPSKSATATVTLAPVSVTVSPATVTLSAGQTQQFTATASNGTVTWAINPSVGSISATGVYTAPASVAAAQAVTVTATSVADPSKSAAATVNLSPGSAPPPSSNLAQGKAATQSSTVGPASRAVDGNTDGNYFNGSVAHTGADPYAWWQVDLGASYAISAVTLWNRTDCCGDRLSDYWVFVSDTPYSSGDTPATLQTRVGTWSAHRTSAPQPSATVTPNAQGRYVRVQLNGANNLQLAEVQVFGSAPGMTVSPSAATLSPGASQQFAATIQDSPGAAVTWSISPNVGSISAGGVYTAPASVGAAQSVVVTARGVADSSKMASATVSLQMSGVLSNLAQGKAATQSSTFGVGAAAAVDGNTDGNYWNGSVSQTNQEIMPWWQVDLGRAATVGSVVVWNRTDCCGSRLGDYWVFVSSTPFAPEDTPATLQGRGDVWSSHQTSAPDPSVTIPVAAHGRYVRIQLSGLNALHMGEVQVFGAWLADDIAIGKTATQSTTWAPASRAVDGNTDGSYWNGSVNETAPDANAWWQVDLGASAGVGSVAIWNRTDCCGSRLSDYWVFVSDTPFSGSDTPATLQSRAGTWSSHQTAAPNPAAVIPVNAAGRYVRIQLSGANNLHMAEVEVFGAFP